MHLKQIFLKHRHCVFALWLHSEFFDQQPAELFRCNLSVRKRISLIFVRIGLYKDFLVLLSFKRVAQPLRSALQISTNVGYSSSLATELRGTRTCH